MRRHTQELVKLVAPGEKSTAWAYFDEDGRLLRIERDGHSAPRRETGRPGQWKGRLGLELIDAVANARANGAKDTAAAIRALREQKHRDLSLDRQWRDYKARYLEKAYVEAKKFWWPYTSFERSHISFDTSQASEKNHAGFQVPGKSRSRS